MSLLPSRKIHFFPYLRSPEISEISTLFPYLTVWVKYVFMKTFIVCSIIIVFQSLYLGRCIFFVSYVNKL